MKVQIREAFSWKRLLFSSVGYWVAMIFGLLGLILFCLIPDGIPGSSGKLICLDHNLTSFSLYVLAPALFGLCLGLPLDLLGVAWARIKAARDREKADSSSQSGVV